MDGGAYGAGKAGGAFDPIAFIKKPQVILRVVSWVFSIIVFGCIASGGWEGPKCRMNADPNACGFGTVIGVIAFLACIAFLALDAVFEQLSGIQHRKYVVMADMGFSGLWSFMWFVCFCYMTNKWTTTPPGFTTWGANDVQAAIAFSFFSIISWVALTVLAVLRYRQGVTEDFAPSGYEQDGGAGGGASPYSPYPGGSAYPGGAGTTSDAYQQPPFTPGQDEKTAPDYQPPTY